MPIDISKDDSNYEATAVLVSLGIMDLNDDGSFRGDEFVTRAELAKIAAVIHGIDVTAYKDSETSYSDVKKDDDYACYITACREFGLMSGDSELFEPDGNITADQLNAVVMRLMGYEIFANRIGEYPSGYNKVSELLKIRRYLHQNGEYMTRNETAEYLYEAFNTSAAQVDKIAGDSIEYQMDGNRTLSELYMGIRRFEGVVNANEFSHLPGKSTVSVGKVDVGGTVMGIGTTNIRSELGKYVVAYAYVDAMGNAEDVKAYVTPSKYNEETEILAKDLKQNETNSRKITAWNENKTKSYSLASDCVVIKNGEVLNSYSDDVFDVATGKINIISTDGDRYNLVIVDAPESAIFKRYSQADCTMYFNYGTEKLTMPYEAVTEVFVDGEAASLSDLSEWMSVFVYKSENHNYYRFEASSKTVKGAYTTDEIKSGKIGIDKIKYNTAAELEDFLAECKPMLFGAVYTFIFNPYDEVTAIIEEETRDGEYGFVYSSDKGMFDDMFLLLINENNEKKKLKLRKKVSLECGASVQSVNAAELMTNPVCGLVDENGQVIKQLVKYNLNSAEEVYRICIAADNTGNLTSEGDYFTLDMKKFGSGTVYYYNGSFGGVYLADSASLKVFTVPAEVVNGVPNIKDVRDLEVEDDTCIKSMYLNNFYLYDADKYRKVGAMVRFVDSISAISSDIIGRPETAVISEVQTALLENGDTGYIIEYWQGGKLLSAEADMDLKTASCSTNINWSELEGTNISDLKCGDIAQVLLDSEGKIKNIYLLGSAATVSGDHERVSSSSASTPTAVSSTKTHTIPGTVTETNDSYIVVSTVAGNGTVCERSFTKNASTRYYMYNSKRDTVSLASADEVENDDKVFARLDGYLCRMVLIIR